MKAYIPLISLLTFIPSALTAQTTVESWQFNDGDSFTTTSNDGIWNSAWNFNPTEGTYSIDTASSSLVLPGNYNTGSTSTLSAAPVSGGTDKYLFEVTFSGWNFTSVDTDKAWLMGVGIRGDGGTEDWVGRVYLRYDGTVDLRASTNTNATANPRALVDVASDLAVDNSGASATSVTVGVEFDFGTKLVRYFVNGVETHSWTDRELTPANLNEVSIGRWGGTEQEVWNDANAFVSVDSIVLTKLTGGFEPVTWAGYPIAGDGVSVDTGNFIGWINILHDPWIWCYNLATYLYLPEGNVSTSGAWIYVLQ